MDTTKQTITQATNSIFSRDATGAQASARRMLMPSSVAVAAKMLGIFREELNVLLKKNGWTDEDEKAFRRLKEAIHLVEG